MLSKLLAISGLLCVLWVGTSRGQTSYPMITHTSPVAVQRGKTSEVTVTGQMDFSGVYKVLFEGAGISAEVAPSPATPSPTPTSKPARRVVAYVTTIGR